MYDGMRQFLFYPSFTRRSGWCLFFAGFLKSGVHPLPKGAIGIPVLLSVSLTIVECPPVRTARPARPWARVTISSPGSPPAPSRPSAWRIGTEHEKFLFHVDTLKPVPYAGPRGVRA